MSVSDPDTDPATSVAGDLPAPRRESFLPTAFQIWIGISIGVAIKFAGLSQLFSSRGIPFVPSLAWLGELAIGGILAGIGGALLFRAYQAKQIAWMQPGHWLAVESLGQLVASLLASLLQSDLFFLLGVYQYLNVIIVAQLVECALGTTWYVLVIRQQRENRAWQAFAWASALLFGTTALLLLLMLLGGQWSVVYGVAYLLAVTRLLLVVGRWLIAGFATANDLRTGNGRDTLHWIGLVCSALGIVALMIQYLRLYFMQW